jgi:DNA-binding PadR family transcriptional regulator
MDDKLLLLGLLRQQEMHGYQLYDFIERSLSACTDLKKPAAYYLLARMAQDGWLDESTSQQGSRPPRKVYRLTTQGEAAFQDLLRQNLASFTLAAFPGDIGLAFLDSLEPGEALRLLQARRQALLPALNAARHAPHHAGSQQLTIDHQVHVLESELAWLDGLVQRLQDENLLSAGNAPNRGSTAGSLH